MSQDERLTIDRLPLEGSSPYVFQPQVATGTYAKEARSWVTIRGVCCCCIGLAAPPSLYSLGAEAR